MSMASCPQCSKRSGKRQCRALHATICSRCCAASRMIELACPEECPYLREARSVGGDRRSQAIMRRLREIERWDLVRGIRNLGPIVFLVERGIIQIQRERFRDLTDAEALEGVEAALATVRTLEKGIIYEHPVGAARAQAVIEAILREVEAIRSELREKGEDQSLTNEMVAVVLEFIQTWIKLDMNAEGQVYLRHIALDHPYPAEQIPLIVAP